MALPWLSILKNVPWSEVIQNAPKLAEGARKLWKTVGRKTASKEPENGDPGLSADPSAGKSLETRLSVLESGLSDLQAQMLASSELIKALAEQNTQLVKRIDTLRRWLIRLTIVSIALTIVACIGIVRAIANT